MKVRQVHTYNKGLFTTIKEFELKKKDNGKSTLGTGSFGSVHLYNHTSTSTLYAIKSILGTNITTPYEQEGVEREIKVHIKSNHANIAKLYDAFQENDVVYMVLEYVPNGNLYNYIQKKKRLDEKEACKFFVQTAKSLQYLHDNNVFHRDIKPENLLLDTNNNIKLCDFGWCAENIHLKRKTFCGTYEYMAPEIVSDIPYDYTIDIWSLGVLLYEMLHGYAPFRGKEYKEIASNIKSGNIRFSSSVNQDAIDLIKSILVKDPTQRPSINSFLQSPFVMRTNTLMCFIKQNSLKISEFTSPRTSSQNEAISKYQSPMSYPKPHTRPHQVGSESSIKTDSSKNIFKSPSTVMTSMNNSSLYKNLREDVKKKINFETPLKEITFSFQNHFHSTEPMSLGNSSRKLILQKGASGIQKVDCSDQKQRLNGKSKSGCIDENKILQQQKEDDQYFHVEEQQYKTERVNQKSQDFEKILKVYMRLCIDKKQ